MCVWRLDRGVCGLVYCIWIVQGLGRREREREGNRSGARQVSVRSINYTPFRFIIRSSINTIHKGDKIRTGPVGDMKWKAVWDEVDVGTAIVVVRLDTA